MHYIQGQEVLGGSYNIHLIEVDGSDYKIWVERNNEVLLWKSFGPNMPISVEYNINF